MNIVLLLEKFGESECDTIECYASIASQLINEKYKGSIKAYNQAYNDKLGRDNSGINKAKAIIGSNIPTIPGSKRNKAKHAGLSALHAKRSE